MFEDRFFLLDAGVSRPTRVSLPPWMSVKAGAVDTEGRFSLDTEGRAYFQHKRAEGKSHKEAMRCLKKRLSDVVCRHLLHDEERTMAAGPGGRSGTALSSSVAD